MSEGKQVNMRLQPESLAALEVVEAHFIEVARKAGFTNLPRRVQRSEATAMALEMAARMLRTKPDGSPEFILFRREALLERLGAIAARAVAEAVAEREILPVEAAVKSRISLEKMERELLVLQDEALND